MHWKNLNNYYYGMAKRVKRIKILRLLKISCCLCNLRHKNDAGVAYIAESSTSDVCSVMFLNGMFFAAEMYAPRIRPHRETFSCFSRNACTLRPQNHFISWTHYMHGNGFLSLSTSFMFVHSSTRLLSKQKLKYNPVPHKIN